MGPKIIKAIEWLWEQRETEMFFGRSIFTNENTDKDHKFERLTIKESENLLTFLCSKNLIYTRESNNNYVINSLMAADWKKLLKEIKSSWIIRLWYFIISNLFIFTLTLLSGIIAGVTAKFGDKIFDYIASYLKQ